MLATIRSDQDRTILKGIAFCLRLFTNSFTTRNDPAAVALWAGIEAIGIIARGTNGYGDVAEAVAVVAFHFNASCLA